MVMITIVDMLYYQKFQNLWNGWYKNIDYREIIQYQPKTKACQEMNVLLKYIVNYQEDASEYNNNRSEIVISLLITDIQNWGFASCIESCSLFANYYDRKKIIVYHSKELQGAIFAREIHIRFLSIIMMQDLLLDVMEDIK